MANESFGEGMSVREHSPVPAKIGEIYLNYQSAKRHLREIEGVLALLETNTPKAAIRLKGEELVFQGAGLCKPALKEFLETQRAWVSNQVTGLEKLIAELEKCAERVHSKMSDVLGPETIILGQPSSDGVK